MQWMFSLLLLGLAREISSVGGSDERSRRSLRNGGVVYAAAPSERGAFHVGGKGVYNYGYNTGEGVAKVEVRHPDGTVTGSYRYFDPSGRQILRSYIADKKGFRVLGNELPVAPDAPAIGIPDAQVLTGAVEGTREFSSPYSGGGGTGSFNAYGGEFYPHQPLETGGTDSGEFLTAQLELIREQELKLEEMKRQHRIFLEKHEKLEKLQLEAEKLHLEAEKRKKLESDSEILHSEAEKLEKSHPEGEKLKKLHLETEKLKKLHLETEKLEKTASEAEKLKKLHLETEKRKKLESEPGLTHQRIFQSGYTDLSNRFPGDSPYFFADDSPFYDFPAGFAYDAQPIRVYYDPIGVKGENPRISVTAGHTSRVEGRSPRISVTSGHNSRVMGRNPRISVTAGHTSRTFQNPVYSYYNSRFSSKPRARSYGRPFILGHSR